MKVTYTEEAVADVVQAIAYLKERNPSAAATLDADIGRGAAAPIEEHQDSQNDHRGRQCRANPAQAAMDRKTDEPRHVPPLETDFRSELGCSDRRPAQTAFPDARTADGRTHIPALHLHRAVASRRIRQADRRTPPRDVSSERKRGNGDRRGGIAGWCEWRERFATASWCRRATISRCSATRERTKKRSEWRKRYDDGHDESSLIGRPATSIVTRRRKLLVGTAPLGRGPRRPRHREGPPERACSS